MTSSTTETKALQSRSERLQQSIFWLLAHPVAQNCFRRRTFHVLISEFGSARLCSAYLKRVLLAQYIYYETNCQYHHSDLYCVITLYSATTIDLQLRSILDLCEIGPIIINRFFAESVSESFQQIQPYLNAYYLLSNKIKQFPTLGRACKNVLKDHFKIICK